ncbi:type I restriction-modification system, specificity subunit S [Sporolactobacillus inulinus]|uniref:Type I restriction-modification system, specificity subunit S n=1 Tax=Sporolactobacillus inulinus TaxID=2078 RepID=A0A4Y1ZC95_9BACL|nr:restriction endonuclease subunit S [Sporolactobacillus inulinus]GAY76551.1 type I restriction-modification system, specificity subunit S [Sporolactobacillus inulinus]
MRFKYVRLGDVAIYLKEKIYTNKIRLNNYVSTENLKPDIGGVDSSNKLPTTKMITKFNKWNILISNIRPYFKKIWLADWSGGCSNDVLVLKATDKINIFYLYYNLACDRFFDFVMAGAKGTKMPRGDKDHIMKYELMLPSIDCQKFIANILSTLDQKIQINSKINQNLEATAQAIFKHWFVDFEFPNEEGKPYKSSGGEMVKSEIGMIPKRWRLCRLKELVDIIDNRGKTPPQEKNKNTIPYN